MATYTVYYEHRLTVGNGKGSYKDVTQAVAHNVYSENQAKAAATRGVVNGSSVAEFDDASRGTRVQYQLPRKIGALIGAVLSSKYVKAVLVQESSMCKAANLIDKVMNNG